MSTIVLLGGSLTTSAISSITGALALTAGATTVTVGPTAVTGVAHTDLSAIGTNTHAAIDTHIGNTTIHFPSPLTTKGDLWCNNGTTSAALPVTSDGQIVTASSAAVTGLAYGAPPTTSSFISSTVFTASNAAWPIPTGTTRLVLTVSGSGGGGAPGSGGNGGSGGGSGSAVVRMPFRGAIPGNTLVITIAAGGASATAGGTSSIVYAPDVNGKSFSISGFGGGSWPLANTTGGGGGGSGGAAVNATGGIAGTQGGIAGPTGTATKVDSLADGFWFTGACGAKNGTAINGGNFLCGYNGGLTPNATVSTGGGGAGGFGNIGGNGSTTGVGSNAPAGSGAGGGGGNGGGFAGGIGGSGLAVIEAWSS